MNREVPENYDPAAQERGRRTPSVHIRRPRNLYTDEFLCLFGAFLFPLNKNKYSLAPFRHQ